MQITLGTRNVQIWSFASGLFGSATKMEVLVLALAPAALNYFSMLSAGRSEVGSYLRSVAED